MLRRHFKGFPTHFGCGDATGGAHHAMLRSLFMMCSRHFRSHKELYLFLTLLAFKGIGAPKGITSETGMRLIGPLKAARAFCIWKCCPAASSRLGPYCRVRWSGFWSEGGNSRPTSDTSCLGWVKCCLRAQVRRASQDLTQLAKIGYSGAASRCLYPQTTRLIHLT